MQFRILIAAALVAFVAAPAEAKRDKGDADPPPVTSQLVVFGDDPCPRSSDNEIVVCARLPESERYRIPKRFRGKRRADAPAPDSWAQRVDTLETVSREGLPNSCSVVGSGGQTGCMQQFLHQAWQERHQNKIDADTDAAP